MSDIKHSSGEWKAEHDADGDYAIFGGSHGDILLATTTGDTDEDRANAYLIASAPDMLAALKQIAELPPDSLRIKLVAILAINKAEMSA